MSILSKPVGIADNFVRFVGEIEIFIAFLISYRDCRDVIILPRSLTRKPEAMIERDLFGAGPGNRTVTNFLKLRLRVAGIEVVSAMMFVLLSVLPIEVRAHPHVFVEARSTLVFNNAGMAVAIQHVFRFDDAFSAFAIQGFDTNNDGKYSREELAELAKVNIESMAEYGYFTFGDNTRVELDFNTPTDYWLEVATVPLRDYWAMKPEDFEAIAEDVRMNGGAAPQDVQLLELHFLLPIKEPTDAASPITIDVYDPTYYVDFRFGREETAVGTLNPPGSCSITRKEPPALDDATAYALAQIGPDQRDLPPELQSAASSQVNQMIVTCAAAAGAVAPAGQSDTQAGAPAGGGGTVGNDGSSTAGSLASEVENSAPVVEPGLADRVFGTIARLQKDFYQELVAALRAFRNTPNAGLFLMGLSFAYGIFHAAGPGHGKAIITSYMVANNETLKKGIVLSFVSAFAQAVTAILLVGGLAAAFDLTSIVIQDTARWLETGSYVLITALGAWLLWQKLVWPVAAGFLARSGAEELAVAHAGRHHHHNHDHEHAIADDGSCATCGHVHAPTPEMVSGHLTVAKAASIVLAVGLRPCSGALVVLVFALSQGMIAAGITSTLAMALGTGITVAVLAGLAVTAKDVAIRMFGEGSSLSVQLHRGLEIVGALVVFLLGATLLIAALGWGG